MRITPCFASFLRRRRSTLAVAVLSTLAVSPAFAGLYWGSGGVNSAWTTAGNWFTDDAETTVSGAAPTLADDVVFNTTPDNALGGTVTMSSDISANSITFNTSGATLLSQSGNRTLTLGAGGITVNSGAGNATLGVSTNTLSVQAAASQVWTNNSGSILNVRSLRASNTATGTVALTLNAASSGNINFSLSIQDSPDAGKALSIIVDSAGTGIVNLVGSTYTGGTTLKHGVLSTNGTLGSGVISLGVADGTGDARFNATGGVTNNIIVQSGTGLRALTGSGSGDFQGNITLSNDVSIGSVSASGQTLAVSGIISGDHNVTVGRVATGSNNPTVTLSGANTYTGKTSVPSATLVVSSLNSVTGGAASSALGAPTTVENGTISLGAVATSTLRYNGTGETTDRVIDLAGTNLGVTLEQAGTGLLKFTSNLTTTGQGQKTLTLRGTTEGTGEISGVIPNSTSITGLTKTDSGTWRLSGLNTYTGITSITGGVLEVTQLTDGGVASSIGASSNSSGNLTFGGGTLRYVGSGDSTNRIFNVGALGATFDGSGTGAISFTNSTAPSHSTTDTARTITLTGTNTGANTMANRIGNAGTGLTSIIKNGTGTWGLTGANTYTGDTTVNDGKLVIHTGGSLNSGSAVSVTGGELNVNGHVGGSVAVLSGAKLSGSGTIGGAVSVSTGGLLNPGNSPGNLTLNNGLTLSGIYTWDLTALSTSNPGNDFDIVTIISGNVDLTGATLGLNLGDFTPSTNPFWQTTQTWSGILNNTGIGTLTGAFASINNSDWSSLGTFTTTYTGNDVNLVWTAVPEPNSSILAGSLGIVALLRRSRRDLESSSHNKAFLHLNTRQPISAKSSKSKPSNS